MKNQPDSDNPHLKVNEDQKVILDNNETAETDELDPEFPEVCEKDPDDQDLKDV